MESQLAKFETLSWDAQFEILAGLNIKSASTLVPILQNNAALLAKPSLRAGVKMKILALLTKCLKFYESELQTVEGLASNYSSALLDWLNDSSERDDVRAECTSCLKLMSVVVMVSSDSSHFVDPSLAGLHGWTKAQTDIIGPGDTTVPVKPTDAMLCDSDPVLEPTITTATSTSMMETRECLNTSEANNISSAEASVLKRGTDVEEDQTMSSTSTMGALGSCSQTTHISQISTPPPTLVDDSEDPMATDPPVPVVETTRATTPFPSSNSDVGLLKVANSDPITPVPTFDLDFISTPAATIKTTIEASNSSASAGSTDPFFAEIDQMLATDPDSPIPATEPMTSTSTTIPVNVSLATTVSAAEMVTVPTAGAAPLAPLAAVPPSDVIPATAHTTHHHGLISSPTFVRQHNDFLDIESTGDIIDTGVSSSAMDRAALEQRLSELQDRHGLLQRQHTDLTLALEEAQRMSRERKATIETLLTNEGCYKAKIDSLEAECKHQKERYTQLYNSAKEKLDEATKQLDLQDQTIRDLKHGIHLAVMEKETLNAQLKNAKDQLAHTERKNEERLAEAKTKVEQFKASAASNSTAVATLTQKLAAVELAARTTETSLKSEIEQLKAKLTAPPPPPTIPLSPISPNALPNGSNAKTIDALQPNKKHLEWKARLILIYQSGAGPKSLAELDSLPMDALIEVVGSLLQQKILETNELAGYCQQLLNTVKV